MSQFFFRINKLTILDNRHNAWIQRRDRTNVQIVSLVQRGGADLPSMEAWWTATDPEKRKEHLAAAVAEVLARRVLTPIAHVRDNQVITFGDAGYVLYQEKGIPDDFHWQLIVIGDRKSLRGKAAMAREIVMGDAFGGFADELLLLVTGAANPVAAAGLTLGKFVAGQILERYAQRPDDQLGLVYASFNRREHYPHGVRDKQDVYDLTGNLRYDYSMFGYE